MHLTTSFRSVPSIQRAVNAAFAPKMDGDPQALQAEYVALSEYRAEESSQPSVVALPVPRPYGKRNIAATAIESSLPDAVGAFVDWLVRKSGWTVTERERPGVRVPVAARHVCLLFRRLESFFTPGGDVARGYVQALEARGIAHLLVGGKSFHAREEVETVRTALAAIEWPDDELSVFATLHGSLFAIGDAELLAYRDRHRRLHPLHPASDLPEPLAPIGEALAMLAALHRRRNRRPVAETINELLEATRAHAGFVLRPSGEQVLANVLHVTELARAYERSGGGSFRGFVDQLTDDADGGKTAEAPILEEGSDGVRLMTVHKAKGLEFPVVILADLTAKMWRPPASRYIDPQRQLCALRIAGWSPVELLEQDEAELKRDEAEGVRVAYVAATRARDLLVVPAVGDEPFGASWLSPLSAAIYPSNRQQKPEAATGCPSFGNDSTIDRPPEQGFDRAGVHPGAHRFGGGPLPGPPPFAEEAHGGGDRPRAATEYSVVWWDPGTLDLDAQPQFGLRQENLIDKGVDDEAVAADVGVFHAWERGRDAALMSGMRPALLSQIVTQRAHEMQDTAAEVELIELPIVGGRPGGPRFGALVHSIFATVALDGRLDDIEEVARLQARVVGATDEEVAAAVSAVDAAWRHALLERARAAEARGQCRREAPVVFRTEDGTIVDGAVDLAFLEDGVWTVVDFKTDREMAGALESYRRQVALYAEGIRAATGQEARGVLLRV